MGILITVSVLIIFNVAMWLVFLSRFNRFFSTEDIIKKTRDSLNSMLTELNRNADRNITLMDDRIRQIKAVSAEADRHLLILQKELNSLQAGVVFKEKLADKKKHTRSNSSIGDIRSPYPSRPQDSVQGDLFTAQEEKPAAVSSSSSNSTVKVPVFEPKVFMAEKPVVPKKDFNEQVKELSGLGFNVFEIVAKTGRSIQEVKLALELR